VLSLIFVNFSPSPITLIQVGNEGQVSGEIGPSTWSGLVPIGRIDRRQLSGLGDGTAQLDELLPVHLIAAAEVVDDFDNRFARNGMALILRQLEVFDEGIVFVFAFFAVRRYMFMHIVRVYAGQRYIGIIVYLQFWRADKDATARNCKERR
jgi:hypothetical protein